MFNLLDCVKLKRDRADIGVNRSHTGVIVDILEGGKAYTVEFFDENNETIEASLYVEFDASELKTVS